MGKLGQGSDEGCYVAFESYAGLLAGVMCVG